jgi:hypothetical protein
MKEARALYASMGFREIAPNYDNPLPPKAGPSRDAGLHP